MNNIKCVSVKYDGEVIGHIANDWQIVFLNNDKAKLVKSFIKEGKTFSLSEGNVGKFIDDGIFEIEDIIEYHLIFNI